MKFRAGVIATAAAACALLTVGSAAQPAGARPERPRVVLRGAAPVVVELFTAQGCGGCVDANATVERAPIVALQIAPASARRSCRRNAQASASRSR